MQLMSISKEQVIDALRHVNDPDLKKDLVTLNMVENVVVEGDNISFTVVLTTPACPLKDVIEQDCRNAIAEHVSATAVVNLTFDAKVTTRRFDKKDVLPGVKNIIAVSSGKGGVGKSTIAVNLALALQRNGSRVGLVDADIYGPSVPLMLGIKGKRPTVQQIDGKHYIIPLEAHGLKVLSIGLLVDEKQAVVWRGPMTECIWGELDYMILDLPPGTGDVHLTLAQQIPITGAVIVTTPQKVAMADARKGISMFRMEGMDIPILGVVENMSWFTPAELPENKYYLFGQGGGSALAEEFDVPVLGQIPLVQSIREGGDYGNPAVLHDDAITSKAFRDLATNTERQIAIKNNATQKPVEAILG